MKKPRRFVLTFLLLFFFFFLCTFSRVTAHTAPFSATFRGISTDLTGTHTAVPDGSPDFRISLLGLRGTPVEVTVTSDTSGTWHVPFDGVHWVVRLESLSSSTADLYLSQYPSSRFQVVVRYSDGSMDQAAVSDPPAQSLLTAVFRGVGPDVVGHFASSPDGQPDYWISLGGVAGPIAQLRITSETSGVWMDPPNGTNWGIVKSGVTGSAANLHFSQYPGTRFHVQVWYVNGGFDEADATQPAPSSSLTAVFRGIGPDVVSPGNVAPDGTPDYQMTLGGLRAAPTEITITSESSGVWHIPYN